MISIWKYTLILRAFQGYNSLSFVGYRISNSKLSLAQLHPEHEENDSRRRMQVNMDRQVSKLSKALGGDFQRTKDPISQQYNLKFTHRLEGMDNRDDSDRDEMTVMDSSKLPSDAFIRRNGYLLAVTGSLLQSAPDIPKEYFKATNISEIQGEHSVRYLENQLKHSREPVGDSSFRAVFENESGFFNQSEAFHMYLASNNSLDDPGHVIHRAILSRRGEDYRLRQAQALEKLQRDMLDVERTSMSRAQIYSSVASNPTSSLEVCSKCGCRLSKDEIIGAQQVDGKRICRECHVEKMVFQNGSPYLIGRVQSYPNMDENDAQQQLTDDLDHAQKWRELFIASQNQKLSTATSFFTPATSSHSSSTHEVLHDHNKSPSPSNLEQILEQVKKLEYELEHYKRKSENAENEVQILQSVVENIEPKLESDAITSWEDDDEGYYVREENEDDHWVSMVDPDTGESFRWNKYTGATDW